jgi:allantoicase
MTPLTALLDLANERMGGCVLAASDDFFAEKENLIKPADPVFVSGKYTDRGKWMDGWESRRKRTPGHDWAILRLGVPGVIRGVVVDTSYFTGNYPEQCSIEGCEASGNARAEDLTGWTELLPKVALSGDSKNAFDVSSPRRFTHLRLNIFPDGGVARLRVHGVALADFHKLGRDVDLAAAEYGGSVVDLSNRHYGNPDNLIMPGRAQDMSDGWETRRRRGPGHDWVILRLAAEGVIERVEVDTSHFKGNYPDACSLEIGATAAEESWTELLPLTKLKAHTQHVFSEELAVKCSARFVRFNIFPDGGVSRLRLYGAMTECGRIETRLAGFNAAGIEAAAAELTRCCGSSNWAARMAESRPFASLEELEEAADRLWAACAKEDWLAAFGAHPKIGQQSESRWSREEQSGSGEVPAEMAERNREYEEKFGYIFIVCATGKTAPEMLDLLKQRLTNDPADEIRNAAEQQRLITRLRLRKLLTE